MQVLYSGDILVTRTRLPFFHKGLGKKMEDNSKNRKILLNNIMAEKQRIAEETKNHPKPPDFIPKYKRVYNKAKRFVKKHVLKAETTATKDQYTQLRKARKIDSKLKKLIDYQQELVFENRVPTNIDRSLLKARAASVNSEQDKHIFELRNIPLGIDDVTEPEPDIDIHIPARVDSNGTPATKLLNSRTRAPVANKQTERRHVEHPSTTEKNEFKISPPLQNVSAEPASILVTSKHGSHKKENQAVESSVPLQEPAIRVSTERKPIRAAEKKNPTTQSRKQIIEGKQTEKPVITPPLKVVPLKSFLLSDIQEEELHIKSKNLLKRSTKGTQKVVKEINRRFVERVNQQRVRRKDQIVQSEVERATQQRAQRRDRIARSEVTVKNLSNASTAEIAEHLIEHHLNGDTQHLREFKQLGHGKSGYVFNYRQYVVKFASPDGIKSLNHEIDVLSHFNHPHIIQMLHSGEYKNVPYIVQPYLKDYISLDMVNVAELDKKHKIDVRDQIGEVLNIIHKAGHAHYNLIFRNIMYNPLTKQICIIEFMNACFETCFQFNDALKTNPAYPPYYGVAKLNLSNGIRADNYFFAVVNVYILSGGTVNPNSCDTRSDYMNAVKTFLSTEKTNKSYIIALFILSAIHSEERKVYNALDKPIEATGNPPGKEKPKKFAKSAERLEYKEYSPKVKGVIKTDFKATNELRFLSPFIICVAIIAYARARIANRTMRDLPKLEVNMSDIHYAWNSYEDAAKGVYDQTLPLRERVARVVHTVKNKRTLFNLPKRSIYKYESGAANFLYKLTFDGTYNCVAGTLLMYTLIKYCDNTIDVRFALITGHVLLAFYDNGTEMFLETATERTPILSRNEVEQEHKKTVFVCPKEHPTGMTQICEYLINMVSMNFDEYDDNLIFQCIPLLMRYNLQHSDDLNVKLFTNLCLRRCVSNMTIKPYDCVQCIYTTLNKSLWTNKNKCLYTICLTSFPHILNFIRPDSLLNEFKHFKNITVNQTLLKIHKMLIDIDRTIKEHRRRYHAESDCSQIDEKRVQSNRRLVGLAELARTKIPHKRILKLSSDLKQTRFNTYEKKAEYLIDNYNDKLGTQFTFISKNVYVCDNIVIKFAPNTTDEHLQYELLEYEIYILSQLKDKTKHIVNILHYGNYNNHLYLITSNLTKYIPLNEITDFHFDYRSVYHQVQEALRVMHEHGYAHYNMVLNNIMFNPNTKQICIVDFSRFCVKDLCLHTDTLDSKSPSYPPYYGQILAANQPKHTDYYFMAVVLVFLISKGTVNPINKTRTQYMNAVKTFVRTLTDQHKPTQIKTTFVLSAIDDSGRFSYEQIFSAHTPKSTPWQKLDAQYLIDTEIFNDTRDYERKGTIQKVGEGTYGCVFRIGLEFIIKIPRKNEIESLTHEINIFKGISVLNHPNIVTYVYSGTYRDRPYLILTYLKDYMTLYHTVQYHTDYNTQNIYDQIMSAVNAIHNAGYAHYDLSLGNIMYNHTTGHVCIIDFGVSCHIECKGIAKTDLNSDPAFPPHHGNGRMPTEQGKTSDQYFIAVAVVYMLSNGKINHYEEKTRIEYMTKFNAFLEKPEFKKWQQPVTDLLMASFNYIDPL